jgi:hypothetical protein
MNFLLGDKRPVVTSKSAPRDPATFDSASFDGREGALYRQVFENEQLARELHDELGLRLRAGRRSRAAIQ